MKTAIIALTKGGSELAVKIGPHIGAHMYLKKEFILPDMKDAGNIFTIDNGLATLIKEVFHRYEALIFIMACGIVVRIIAPYIGSKTTDPAVVVMDEKGKHIISLLSGHLGGANRMAERIAGVTGGTAVITTATDINDIVAFDMFAIENNCSIENIHNLKYISAELVNGGRIGLYTDCRLEGSMPGNIILSNDIEFSGQKDITCRVILSSRTGIEPGEKRLLFVRPRNLVLGIGCRRHTSKKEIELAVQDFMKRNNRSHSSIKCLATIDLKKDEKGLLEFCEEHGLELKIVPREAIESMEGNFIHSDFVKEKVGVAGVAEPCAVIGSSGGRLIRGKTVYKGITLALAEEEKVYRI
ncbi:MAG: cobalt-precorrin 5A hydrolase [Clostridia bacterium]|nr:cobalt-precorrin 5A hydrolase [Clostridia bacterium]